MQNNKKIYIISFSFLLICLLLVIFLIWPLFKEIKKSSADLIFAKGNLVALSAQTIETENFKKNYTGYKPNFDKIDALFIDPDNPVPFIEFLENTAFFSGITAKVALPSTPATSQKFITIQFSSKGDFNGILDFVSKIEKGQYLIEIENMAIQSLKDSGVEATFTIKVFIEK